MKVILFDADGVLTLAEEYFVEVYAQSRGFDPEPFEEFFKNDWQDIVTGKKDLKESINEHADLWQWHSTADELIALWCKTEDVRNEELIKVVKQLKEAGYACCLATDQEKYRGEYIRNVMFKDLFEDYFISAELGVAKTDLKFFELVIESLQKKHSLIKSEEIIFFDDSQSKVDSAKTAGLDARLYTSVDQVRAILEL